METVEVMDHPPQQHTPSDHSVHNERASSPEQQLEHLRHAIEHAAQLLPAQGPIRVYITRNTLYAFEEEPFEEAVVHGSRVFGCHPFLTEDRYRQELQKGRIRFQELREVLEEHQGKDITAKIPLTTRFRLRLAMLQFPLLTAPDAELAWFVAETDALRRVRPEASFAVKSRLIAETRRWVMRDIRHGDSNGNAQNGSWDRLFERYPGNLEIWSDCDWESFTLQALWRQCRQMVHGIPSFVPAQALPIRHRDLLLLATGSDADVLVHEPLIRFVASFLDQGLAQWILPERSRGLFGSFVQLYGRSMGPPDRWMKGLGAELKRLEKVEPIEVVRESLNILGVPSSEWEAYLSASLLALRGWAGMVRQIEERSDRVACPIPQGSLVEFLAIRLLLDRLAMAYLANETLDYQEPLSGLRDKLRAQIKPPSPPTEDQRAFAIFQLAQVMGWSPDLLHRLGPGDAHTLLKEIETFSSVERRQIFHLAYERRFWIQSLDAISLHAKKASARPKNPRFQAIFCLDEREESMRRHLEEVAGDVETFGAAGFFGVPMYYRGASDAHFVPLCPVIFRPKHWVTEQVVDSLEKTHQRRARARKALGAASLRFHMGSRSFALGAILATLLGVLASIPLVARILFPRLTSRIRSVFGNLVRTPPQSRLHLERCDPTPGPENGQVGFSLNEMVNIGERLLRDIGLIDGFARLVLIVGHGSKSLNNPHKSAYDCGACGGSQGGPNARALAFLLNDVRVRQALETRGLRIPSESHFVGGWHNTCSDRIEFLDQDLIPPSHIREFEAARNDIESACDRNAHERSRRFMSAPLTMSFKQARQHVEGRSEDLAQTRPECGHATNALCIIGRRQRTRGLYLDRRAFLVSYDPTQDNSEAAILANILGVVFTVCGGINLEYFFSHTDSRGFGSGTKLPHNITSLIGVMDGAASDLRTGLPWQMVEIHEPMRLLVLVEVEVEKVLGILQRFPMIRSMSDHRWIQLAVLDPNSGAILVYRHGKFEPYHLQAAELPQAATSVDWYRGWRDHLEFAEIG